MAKVVKVSYSRETSVKISQYQYIKPTIEVTAMVEEGEEFDDVFQAVKHKVKEYLRAEEVEILAQHAGKPKR